MTKRYFSIQHFILAKDLQVFYSDDGTPNYKPKSGVISALRKPGLVNDIAYNKPEQVEGYFGYNFHPQSIYLLMNTVTCNDYASVVAANITSPLFKYLHAKHCASNNVDPDLLMRFVEIGEVMVYFANMLGNCNIWVQRLLSYGYTMRDDTGKLYMIRECNDLQQLVALGERVITMISREIYG